MSISSRRESWDSHRKFRRKAQDRGVCLLGEWVSLITVPRCCLPTPFLDNKTLPASFILPSEQPALLWQTWGCTQPSMNDAACLMDYMCPFRVSRVHKALIFTIATLAEDHSICSFSSPLPPKLYLPHCWVGLPTHSNPSRDLLVLGGLGWCWKPPNANIKLSFDGDCCHGDSKVR